MLNSHYLAADYIVDGSEPLVLKVNCASSALLGLHHRHGVDCSAFLTAFNPFSQRCSDEENMRAQQELILLLGQGGYVNLPGRGVDPGGSWPAEESVLVLGISASEASRLARHFRQNALLAMAADAVPRLVWVQPAESPAD